MAQSPSAMRGQCLDLNPSCLALESALVSVVHSQSVVSDSL